MSSAGAPQASGVRGGPSAPPAVGGGRSSPSARSPLPTELLAAFFLPALALLAAAALVACLDAVAELPDGRWLALHLALVGGVSQLVLGASQFFAGAYLATDPPPRPLLRAQLALWNGGTLLLAVAVPAGSAALSGLAAALLALALCAYAAGLRGLERRSLQRAPWATRWYLACAGFLVAGVVLGAALASGTGSADALAAHLALNLSGWLGGAILGTLHGLYPSLALTGLRLPQLQRPAFAAWLTGTVALAAGAGLELPGPAIAGWLLLLAAALLVLVNVAASARAAREPLSLPALLVGLAQAFLVAGLVAALAGAAADGAAAPLIGAARAPVAVLLLAGWIALTVLGSLLHLLGVLLGAGAGRPVAAGRRRADLGLAAASALAVAALALARSGSWASWLEAPAAIATALALLALFARVVALAARVARRARPLL